MSFIAAKYKFLKYRPLDFYIKPDRRSSARNRKRQLKKSGKPNAARICKPESAIIPVWQRGTLLSDYI